MDWQDERNEADRSTQAVGSMLLTSAAIGVVVVSIVLVTTTGNGHWYALPFGFAAGALFHAGAARHSLAPTCAGFLLALVALNMSGVLG